MIRFKPIPGIVLTNICGEYLLVAAKSLRGSVPYLSQLNESSAFLWRRLENGSDEDELIKALLNEYEIEDPASARSAVQRFVEQMLQAGYLRKEGD